MRSLSRKVKTIRKLISRHNLRWMEHKTLWIGQYCAWKVTPYIYQLASGGAKNIWATFVEFNQGTVMSSRTEREDRTRVVTTRSIYHYVTCAICIAAYSYIVHCGDETNTISKSRYWYLSKSPDWVSTSRRRGLMHYQNDRIHVLSNNGARLGLTSRGVITRFNFSNLNFLSV